MKRRQFAALALQAAAVAVSATTARAWAQAAPATSTVRLRATIEKVDGHSITVRERGGEVITLTMADNMTVTEIVPIELAAIQPGSYIGTAAVPAANGTLQALEVHVFPEAMRGTGEGHRPFDLQPQSTMTNATVEGVTELVAASGGGRVLKLRYKDGEKTVNVPAGVPVVTYKPGDRSLVVAGARVIIVGELRDGKPVALRISAGRNGFAPPM